MKEKRDKPYIWVTWLSKLISGESQCEWAAWFKAHFKSEKSSSSNFDLVKWTINHNKLLHKRRDELEQQSYKVQIEDQNSFRLDVIKDPQIVVKDSPLAVFTVSGKVDIVALKDGKGQIEDCKTGRCKNSDQVQVMLYMIFLPMAIEKYKDIIFNGSVIYKDTKIPIYWEDIDDDLKEVVWNLVGRIGGDGPCRKVPSYNECKWCDISKEDCPQKMEG